ncbi:metalloprotein [Salinivibrio sp. PR6]|uniref:WbuC family cupin fold metalloprotein n=1 Tax=Salinivibrio sp. PR6 TaxID=1909485 RepID=UPI0009893FB8|nr:WbuC family cupin fold metalloprotein [Salinivibrio sp. PR6]OOE78659.1 metalloprotein [Salinivibrio sp. PR6]
MKEYSDESFSALFDDAEKSERKRAHLNLHANYDEKVQRLFIALVKGSYVAPHYHELDHQWEMFVVIHGIVEVTLYDGDGKVKQKLAAGDGQSGKVIEIDPRDIHSVECISEKALLLEVKEGPFDPEKAKVMFSPTEPS